MTNSLSMKNIFFASLCLALTVFATGGEREMSTDRPDQTESPFTVPAGRLQIESGLFSYTRSIGEADVNESIEWGSFLLRFGLTHNTDLEAGVRPWTINNPGSDGISDLIVRLKWNLLGNDGGKTAIALLPYVTMPTGSDQIGGAAWGGGLIIPVSFQLSDDWSLGTMAFLALEPDSQGDQQLAPGLSASLGHALNDKLGCYIEGFAQTIHEADWKWEASLDIGFTYALNERVQLDLGLNWFVIGERRLNPFIGCSIRI